MSNKKRAYRLEIGSAHDKFQSSRAKIQMFGGGFGNGKTTAGVIKALQIAKDYPGSNGLVARSTYPKLSSTVRKEFNYWTPPEWQARNVDSKQNLIELTNGSTINFSHVQQTGKSQESSTSNLLSATYDWILIDQIEDPEITEKDFLDLLGRLRGQTPYQGDDPTMPASGPRWFMVLCNPTRNWVYRKLVKPVHDLRAGIHNPDLMVDPETGDPMIEIVEASTYENKDNLPEDFISTLEGAYKGQMRERFLLGKWGAYEGLVYPEYDPTIHTIDHGVMENYYNMLLTEGVENNVHEAYDHGIAQPACYLFSFTDPVGNVFVMDGFYEKEQTIRALAKKMKQIREGYGIADDSLLETDDEFDEAVFGLRVLADPAVFRRTSGNSATVGRTVSGLFKDEGIKMQRANNDILSGIAKVQSYLYVDEYHRHPIYPDVVGAPRIFFSKKLDFLDREFVDYYWKKNTDGQYDDIPQDKNDHGMDTVKYLLTHRPRVATFRAKRNVLPPRRTRWREIDTPATSNKRHRYA